MQSHPLDGDGINFELYKYLCRVSRKTAPVEILFKIPDTVVFANGCASVWYYFDDGTQSVCQRPARDLDRKNVFEMFSKHRKTDKCDIVAQFSSWSGDEGHLATIYYTKSQLKAFLFGSSKGYHGILQKFVEPREDHNDLIEVAWSPQMSFSVRRVNDHRILDRNLAPAVRAATFDGASHVCEETFCNATVRKQMARATGSLVSHFHEVDEEFEIARCVCFFKQDAFDDVWLLYTTSVRIVEAMDGAKNSAAYDPEQLYRKPALVPLLLTMQTLPESRVAKLRRGGKTVVAPPPRRLRGDFFTPAAPVDEEHLEAVSQRRRAAMDDKIQREKQERERLFGVLTKLRREVATLHATLESGMPVARAMTASPSSEARDTATNFDNAPFRGGRGRNGAATQFLTPDGSSQTAGSSSPNRLGGSAGGRPTRSPRRRRSHQSGPVISSVSLRVMEAEADALIGSAKEYVAAQRKFAVGFSSVLSDAFYVLGHDVSGARRPLLHRRRMAGNSSPLASPITSWRFVLPRSAWRWISARWAVISEYGIMMRCPGDRLGDADVPDGADLRFEMTAATIPLSAPAPTTVASDQVECVVLEPLPTGGALQRFAGRVQAFIEAEAELVAQRTISAAAFLSKLAAQQLFDELRQATQQRRERLDASAVTHVATLSPAAVALHSTAGGQRLAPPLVVDGAKGTKERKRSVTITAEDDDTVRATRPVEGDSSTAASASDPERPRTDDQPPLARTATELPVRETTSSAPTPEKDGSIRDVDNGYLAGESAPDDRGTTATEGAAAMTSGSESTVEDQSQRRSGSRGVEGNPVTAATPDIVLPTTASDDSHRPTSASDTTRPTTEATPGPSAAVAPTASSTSEAPPEAAAVVPPTAATEATPGPAVTAAVAATASSTTDEAPPEPAAAATTVATPVGPATAVPTASPATPTASPQQHDRLPPTEPQSDSGDFEIEDAPKASKPAASKSSSDSFRLDDDSPLPVALTNTKGDRDAAAAPLQSHSPGASVPQPRSAVASAQPLAPAPPPPTDEAADPSWMDFDT